MNLKSASTKATSSKNDVSYTSLKSGSDYSPKENTNTVTTKNIKGKIKNEFTEDEE